jgi:predicted nuclease of predicted toxin-antitoxin system
MNLSPRWTKLLKEAEIPAVHWSEIGPGDAPDAVIMAFAARQDYVVLTHDLDFGAILAATRGQRPSVVQIRADDVSPKAIGSKVLAGLRQLRTEPEAGALLTIDAEHWRVRLLPLQGRRDPQD